MKYKKKDEQEKEKREEKDEKKNKNKKGTGSTLTVNLAKSNVYELYVWKGENDKMTMAKYQMGI